MVVFNKNINEVKIQKHRTYFVSKEVKFKFGEYAFVASKEAKIELNQLTFLKKVIKKVVKRKRKKKNRKKKGQVISQGKSNRKKWKAFKIWFFLLPNYVFSKKSKNSRMGKGKGSFLRWVFRIQRGLTIVEFTGLSLYRLKKILNKVNKKLKFKLCLISRNRTHYVPVWSKLNLSIEMFNKYRLM